MVEVANMLDPAENSKRDLRRSNGTIKRLAASFRKSGWNGEPKDRRGRFLQILDNPRLKEIQLRGKLKLGGEIYDCHGYHNGDQIITTYVASIKRLTHGNPRTNRFPRDILCATTETGETFYFNSDQFNLCVALILWDLENKNSLNASEHYYLHPDYARDEFM